MCTLSSLARRFWLNRHPLSSSLFCANTLAQPARSCEIFFSLRRALSSLTVHKWKSNLRYKYDFLFLINFKTWYFFSLSVCLCTMCVLFCVSPKKYKNNKIHVSVPFDFLIRPREITWNVRLSRARILKANREVTLEIRNYIFVSAVNFYIVFANRISNVNFPQQSEISSHLSSAE